MKTSSPCSAAATNFERWLLASCMLAAIILANLARFLCFVNCGDRAEAEAGRGVAAELEDFFLVHFALKCRPSILGGFVFFGAFAGCGCQDGIEQGIGRDIFLVEEAGAFSGSGFVGDFDMLGDFASGGDEVGHGAVADDDEAVFNGLEEFVFDELGEDIGELIKRREGILPVVILVHGLEARNPLEAVVFEDDFVLRQSEFGILACLKNRLSVFWFLGNVAGNHAVAFGALEHERGGDPSVASFGGADGKSEDAGFGEKEGACALVVWVVRAEEPFSFIGTNRAGGHRRDACATFFIPFIGEGAFERGSRNHWEAGVAFALDGLVDRAYAGACADMQGGAGEDGEDFLVHSLFDGFVFAGKERGCFF